MRLTVFLATSPCIRVTAAVLPPPKCANPVVAQAAVVAVSLFAPKSETLVGATGLHLGCSHHMPSVCSWFLPTAGDAGEHQKALPGGPGAAAVPAAHRVAQVLARGRHRGLPGVVLGRRPALASPGARLWQPRADSGFPKRFMQFDWLGSKPVGVFDMYATR